MKNYIFIESIGKVKKKVIYTYSCVLYVLSLLVYLFTLKKKKKSVGLWVMDNDME